MQNVKNFLQSFLKYVHCPFKQTRAVKASGQNPKCVVIFSPFRNPPKNSRPTFKPSFKPVKQRSPASSRSASRWRPRNYLIGQSSLSCLRIGGSLAEAVMRPASLSQGCQGYKRRGRGDPGSGHLSASYTGQVKRLHQDLNLFYAQDIKAYCFF